MDTRRIGELEVSVVGLGCNNFGMRIGEDDTRRVVDAALDAGITYFDTADVYGQTRSEEFLGNVLAGRRAYGGSNATFPALEHVALNLGAGLAGQTVRLRFRIATDLQTGAKHGMVSLEASLVQLYLDGQIGYDQVIGKAQDPQQAIQLIGGQKPRKQ